MRQTSDPELELADERPVTRKKFREADKRYIESMVYVPHTPGSTLKNCLTRMEANLGFKRRVKYAEEQRSNCWTNADQKGSGATGMWEKMFPMHDQAWGMPETGGCV